MGQRKRTLNERVSPVSVVVFFVLGVMGETPRYPSSHRGRRNVHLRPEIRRVAFSPHGGLDVTSKIPSATRFRHIRVSSVHDAAHRSLHAPLCCRLVVAENISPVALFFLFLLSPFSVARFLFRFSRGAFCISRRALISAEIRAVSICHFGKLKTITARARRTCIAIHILARAAFVAPTLIYRLWLNHSPWSFSMEHATQVR